MNKNLKKNLAIVFLIFMAPFVLLAILSIWDFVGEEVVWRSIATVVVLGAATAICMGVLSFVELDSKKKK